MVVHQHQRKRRQRRVCVCVCAFGVRSFLATRTNTISSGQHPRACICCKALPFALSLANVLKKMGGKRNSSGAAVQLPSAEDARLVDPKAEARWNDLDDEGLNAEIKEYRCVFFFFLKSSPPTLLPAPPTVLPCSMAGFGMGGARSSSHSYGCVARRRTL